MANKHQIRCRKCSGRLTFEDRHLGRTIKCPRCSAPVRLIASDAADSSNATPKAKQRVSQEPQQSKPEQKPQRPAEDPLAPPRAPRPKSAKPTGPQPDRIAKNPTKSHPGVDEDLDLDWLTQPLDDAAADSYGNSSDDWDAAAPLPPARRKLAKKKKSSPTNEVAAATTRANRSSSSRFDDASSETTSSNRWLVYGLFFATLIPLAINILVSNKEDFQSRFVKSLQEAEENGQLDNVDLEDGSQVSEDQLFSALPGNRISGALLARRSWMHWLFAGISGIGYTALIMVMFRRFSDALGGALAGAIFTATAGIIMLLCLQWAAFASQGFWIRGRSIVVLLFYIVKFIGYSYTCALQEGNGFMSSFMGFTLGVGICEEICKILPVIVYLGTAKKNTWQGACFVGLASGVGFGVSEGITYSSSYYNGISGGEIYLVRFISCVGLHAVWTGAGAVLLFGSQDSVHGGDYSDLAATLAITLGVPIVLHGLYDTLLKQEMEVGALVVGVLSVGWLVGVVERLTRFESAQSA